MLQRALLLLLALMGSLSLNATDVREPARAIPVVHEVDVVVVGGSSGGVEAALAAAKAGAKALLVAPRPYLGEDICATDRLWLEPGEAPSTELGRAAFAPMALFPAKLRLEGAYAFTYKVDRAASPKHPDTPNASRLTDSKFSDATHDSVQYDGPVEITLDLGERREVRAVVVFAYQRLGDFEVGQFKAAQSQDGKTWSHLATHKNEFRDAGGVEENSLRLICPLSTHARYLKVSVEPAAGANRILLAELAVLGKEPKAGIVKSSGLNPVTPMQVKHTFDQALTAAKVPFLYPSVVTDLLQDSNGRPAGIVMANRSGRQAVIAKIIVDATERGTVARMSSAKFTPYSGGTQIFRRVVVDGPVRQSKEAKLLRRDSEVTLTDRKGFAHTYHEYELSLAVEDATFAAFARAEQIARDLTWTAESTDASETLFQVPPDQVRSTRRGTAPWTGPESVSLENLKPEGVENLFLLGGCADVPRETAAKLVRPVHLMALGERVGRAAAEQASQKTTPKGVSVRVRTGNKLAKGEVKDEGQVSVRYDKAKSVPAAENALPVWDEYDVVVVGGGTGGAPAAIGAGRQGAKTLLIEFLHELGGTGTAGLIASYYHGNRVGFTSEVDAGVAGLTVKDSRPRVGAWVPETKSEWYRREMRKAGVDIWFGAMGQGAVVENGRVTGVVVVTPMGRGVVLAKTVIDSTGNADIAAAAGATCRYTDGTEVAVQGTGLPARELGARYVNTDYLFVDDTDIFDIWRGFVVAREKYRQMYDLGQLVDTRERRQIEGDYSLTPMDILLKRTFPDTIVISRSNFDTHGYTTHPMFMLRPPDRESLDAHLPYRCLLPRGLDGIFVTGLGVSAHRDAIPIIRMQADVQNQGYGAGVAAAMISRENIPTRKLNVRKLQAHLAEKSILPQSVLNDSDSFPLPKQRFLDAITSVATNYNGLEVLLSDVEIAKPLLREALANAAPSTRLVYAHILGMLGDPAGAPVLRNKIRSMDWDQGWNFKGMGQFGMSMSPLDSYMIALARTRDPDGLPVLLEKASTLKATHEFSHFRAVALALELFQDKAAAKTLADLLRAEGISGHAMTNLQTAFEKTRTQQNEDLYRGRELAELGLARALYRCGDYEGLGEKLLRLHAQNLQGHYARHAKAVLNQGRSVTQTPIE